MSATSRGDVRPIVEDLLSHFEATVEQIEQLTQPRGRRGKSINSVDVARFVGVIGFARHVYELGKATLVLVDANLSNQAIPLLRSALECAAFAVWLSQAEDEGPILAVSRESIRNRKATAEDMRKAASAIFRDSADSVPDVDPSAVKLSADVTQARNFGDLCRDLQPGGEDMYVLYRLLSMYSHAGASVAGLYWKTDDDADSANPYALDQPSAAYDDALILNMLMQPLIWSGRALSYTLPTSQRKPYGNFLRAHARNAGTVDDLQLSEAYRLRRGRARRTGE